MLTNNFVRRQTRCALIQNSNDLFFGEVLALHIDLSHFNFMGKISFATVKFSGERSLGRPGDLTRVASRGTEPRDFTPDGSDYGVVVVGDECRGAADLPNPHKPRTSLHMPNHRDQIIHQPSSQVAGMAE